jgi:DNA-binding PadR family transcriptional regulator
MIGILSHNRVQVDEQVSEVRRHDRRQRDRRELAFANTSPSIYVVLMTSRAMQEATFLMLTALAAGSKHGYGIIADVEQISDRRVHLRPGTLYTALDRLHTSGVIRVDREEIVDGRLRRYYALTSEGKKALAAEVERMRANAAVALWRLNPSGGVA